MARLEARRPRGLDLIRRMTERQARKQFGTELEPTQILAHHKPLLVGYGAVGLALERYSKSVPHRLKLLAMLRTSQLTGCEWCMDFGSKLALDGGIGEAELRELSVWRGSERFDAVDRLVLEYAEAMSRTPVDVGEELFARLREHFDDKQVVELTMAIGLENLFGRVNWALGIESENFSQGSYCVRPDAAARAVASAA